MPPIHCQVEENALTTPRSCKLRFLPNDILTTEDIATEMLAINPALTPDLAESAISALIQTLQKNLINGNQVTLADGFIFTLSFKGRLDGPDSPLPPIEESLRVRVHAVADFVKEIHQQATLERVPMTEKLPVISQVKDTTLQLNDVLTSTDVLEVSGDNLDFDPQLGNGECVINGTRSGQAVQTQFGPISNTSIILIPSIPAQDDPWNNEYTLSVSMHYTEHGTLRTGIYRKRLRSPLTVPGLGLPSPPETGILTDSAAVAYVSINGGTVTADERLRIQVLQNLIEEQLLFSLIDMQDGGAAGEEVIVTQNGEYILAGFTGSEVSTLEITVNNYTGLWDMIRNNYGGRLVDVLDVQTGT